MAEAPVETLQQDSALLRAHRDNEAFEHFSYVNEGIAQNIRATEMMSVGMGGSFMEFSSSDSDPRFANTVVVPQKKAGKYSSDKLDLTYGEDKEQSQAQDYQRGEYDQGGADTYKNQPKQRIGSQNTSATSRDPYDY